MIPRSFIFFRIVRTYLKNSEGFENTIPPGVVYLIDGCSPVVLFESQGTT